MVNVNGRPHGDLVAFAIRLQRVKRRCLHQPDHVRRGINRWQFWMMGRERVLELDGFLSFGARADGNLFSHPSLSKKEMSQRFYRIIGSNLRDPRTVSSQAAAVAVRRASMPSSAFQSMRAAFSAASRAASAASGRAAIRFSSCVRRPRAWWTSAVACSVKYPQLL